MPDKPHLTLFDTSPLDSLPVESLEDFKKMVITEAVKPSVALQVIMKKYKCSNPHVTTIVQLLELTFPHVDMDRGGFRFRIVDSAYPNSDPRQFSDNDFDDGLAYLQAHPPELGPNAIETVFRSFKDFEKWLLEDKEKPSVTLRRYMEKYHPLHTTTVIQFFATVYPHIDLYGSDLELRILESCYPNSDPKQFSDEDFDKGIEVLI